MVSGRHPWGVRPSGSSSRRPTAPGTRASTPMTRVWTRRRNRPLPRSRTRHLAPPESLVPDGPVRAVAEDDPLRRSAVPVAFSDAVSNLPLCLSPPPPTRTCPPSACSGFSARQESLYRLVLRQSGSTLSELRPARRDCRRELRDQMTRFAGPGSSSCTATWWWPGRRRRPSARLINEEARRVQSRGEPARRGPDPAALPHADHLASSAPRASP